MGSRRFFGKQARHLSFDLEYMRVLRTHGPKTARQLENVFWIRTARPGCGGDLTCDRSSGRCTEVVLVLWARDIDDTRHVARLAHPVHPRRKRQVDECDLDLDAVVAPPFSMVQASQDSFGVAGRNFVGRSPTSRGSRQPVAIETLMTIGDECHDAAGPTGQSAMIRRALPESSRITSDRGRTRSKMRECGSPDEGAVTKDP